VIFVNTFKMNLFRKLFTVGKSNAEAKDDQNEEISIEEFAKLDADKRIIKIIRYGNTGNLKYYPLLKYSILHDPNLDVKLSALKRIHLFQNDSDCLKMLIDLENHFNIRSVEPYYSMALSKTGIISLEEFKERINKS
jgi:hypothetical protein